MRHLTFHNYAQLMLYSLHAWPLTLFTAIRDEPYQLLDCVLTSARSMPAIFLLVCFSYIASDHAQRLAFLKRSKSETLFRCAMCIVGWTTAVAAIAQQVSTSLRAESTICTCLAIMMLLLTATFVVSDLFRVHLLTASSATEQCKSCHYSLRGLTSPERCPECGAPTHND
jgi:hypothetical protein